MQQIVLNKDNTLDFFLALMEKIKAKWAIKLDINSNDLSFLNKLICIRNDDKHSVFGDNDIEFNDWIKASATVLQKKWVFKKLDKLISSKIN